MIRYFVVAVLLLIVILRTKPAFSGPKHLQRKARPGWAAGLVATLAFLALGTVVPSATLDSWLGGTNWIHLVRNLLAVAAIWLLRDAVMILQESYDGRRYQRPKRQSPWVLGLLLIMIVLPFLFIDRGPTTDSSFMTDTLSQLPAVVYGSVYMLSMAWIGADMALALRGRWASFFALFITGGWAIVLASVDEIVYLVLGHLALGPGWLIELTRLAFYPLLYMGVALVAIGLAVRPLGRRVEAARISHHRRRLIKTINSKDDEIAQLLWPDGGPQAATGADVRDLYRFTIALRDWETKGDNKLTPAQKTKSSQLSLFFKNTLAPTYRFQGG